MVPGLAHEYKCLRARAWAKNLCIMAELGNAARSADPNGSERAVTDELRADLGGRIAHLWLPGETGRVSTLDLLGNGLTLFTGSHGEGWRAAGKSSPFELPVTMRELDELSARALGIAEQGALLVRPDGVPVGLWMDGTSAASELSTAVASVTARRHSLASRAA